MRGRPPQLTEADVRYLRTWRATRAANRKAGEPLKRLEDRLGVSRHAIWMAASGKTYRWVQ